MHVEVCFSITLPPYTYCFLFLVKNSTTKKKKLSVRLYNLCCMCLLTRWFCGSLLLSVDKWRGWCMVGGRSGKSVQRYHWLHCTAIRMHYIRHDFFQVQHQESDVHRQMIQNWGILKGECLLAKKAGVSFWSILSRCWMTFVQYLLLLRVLYCKLGENIEQLAKIDSQKSTGCPKIEAYKYIWTVSWEWRVALFFLYGTVCMVSCQ